MGPERGHVKIPPPVDDDNAVIPSPSILRTRMAGDENISEPEGEFFFSFFVLFFVFCLVKEKKRGKRAKIS